MVYFTVEKASDTYHNERFSHSEALSNKILHSATRYCIRFILFLLRNINISKSRMHILRVDLKLHTRLRIIRGGEKDKNSSKNSLHVEDLVPQLYGHNPVPPWTSFGVVLPKMI